MRSAIPKRFVMMVGMALVVVFPISWINQSRSRAQNYPTWPKYQNTPNSKCQGTFRCTPCPDPYDPLVVYGSSAAGPANDYYQGDCDVQGTGTGPCTGTYYRCTKVQCKNGLPDNPPRYDYSGNWCNDTTPKPDNPDDP